MRAIITAVAVILSCTLAWGRAGLPGHNPSTLYPGTGYPSAYTGPGDVVAGAVSWYGVRAYTAAIAAAATQPLVNVSRASDSHTCDILVATDGFLGITASCSTGGENGTTAAAWCNATTCSISTLYDQAGVKNMTNATLATQPTLLFSCVNGRVCMAFTATQTIGNAAPTTTAQPITFSLAWDRTGNFTLSGSLFGGGGASPQILTPPASTNTWILNAGSNVSAVAQDTLWHSGNAVINGASSNWYVDGADHLGNAGADTMNSARNSFIGNSVNYIGRVVEAGYWGIAFDATQLVNMCHNQRFYWNTTGGC